jgi:ribonuclease T1
MSSDNFLRRVGSAMAIGLALLAAHGSVEARAPAIDSPGIARAAELPPEARQTLALIKRGGPFPYARDGAVFANREGRLPAAARGTYREYTVMTPGRHDRGARRIIAAGTRAFWYSADHYRSFRRIIE